MSHPLLKNFDIENIGRTHFLNCLLLSVIGTLWKIQHFSVTHILREINLEEWKSTKNAIFAILGGLNFSIREISAFRQTLHKFTVNK